MLLQYSSEPSGIDTVDFDHLDTFPRRALQISPAADVIAYKVIRVDYILIEDKPGGTIDEPYKDIIPKCFTVCTN